MKSSLSVVMVTRNAEELIENSLRSIVKIASEILIVDAGSTDQTQTLAAQFNARIVKSRTNHLGRNKQKGVMLAKNNWILLLDSDEVVSSKLSEELKSVCKSKRSFDAYIIPFANHYLGKRLRHGGEGYSMVRLFKRGRGSITNKSVHEHLVVKTKNLGKLKSPILHYSYRSLRQMYAKFTMYAVREGTEKYILREKPTIRGIILNPPHMFWARFVEDKGYKDGLFRIPLDLGFAYMEFISHLTLLYLWLIKK